MTVNDPLYKKINLKLALLEDPIELWWNDSQLNAWFNRKPRKNEFFRVQSSPYSILEFEPELIQDLEITDEIRHKDSPFIKKSTLFLKHLQKEEMPIPKDPLLGQFEYPVSFIGFYDFTLKRTKYMDVSNYLTYKFLKEDGIMAEDYLMDPTAWEVDNFEIENLLFVEFSKI